MKLRGFEANGAFYMNSSRIPHLAYATASCSEPNNIHVDDEQGTEDTMWLCLVPGFKYTITCRGVWAFNCDNTTGVRCGGKGDRMELRANETYHASSDNVNNYAKDTENMHIHDVHWTNQDYNHAFVENSTYDFAATGPDSGCTVTLSVTDTVILECRGFGGVFSMDVTTLATYPYEYYFKITKITTLDNTDVINSYAGYYEPQMLATYLDEYWQTLAFEEYKSIIDTQDGPFYIEYGDWLSN